MSPAHHRYCIDAHGLAIDAVPAHLPWRFVPRSLLSCAGGHAHFLVPVRPCMLADSRLKHAPDAIPLEPRGSAMAGNDYGHGRRAACGSDGNDRSDSHWQRAWPITGMQL